MNSIRVWDMWWILWLCSDRWTKYICMDPQKPTVDTWKRSCPTTFESTKYNGSYVTIGGSIYRNKNKTYTCVQLSQQANLRRILDTKMTGGSVDYDMRIYKEYYKYKKPFIITGKTDTYKNSSYFNKCTYEKYCRQIQIVLVDIKRNTQQMHLWRILQKLV